MVISSAKPGDSSPDVKLPSLHSRAVADLAFIRETMANATSYTAFSGWGLILIGFGAILAGLWAAREAQLAQRLDIWLADAGISITIGAISVALKARHAGQPLFVGPIRKFSLSFAPAIVAGAVLTAVLMPTPAASILPGVWLLLYGTGLAAAGTMSVWVIPCMGAGFFALGILALVGPSDWNNALLTAGFSGFHIVFGAVVMRKYGG
jgi:hypothetical protein